MRSPSPRPEGSRDAMRNGGGDDRGRLSSSRTPSRSPARGRSRSRERHEDRSITRSPLLSRARSRSLGRSKSRSDSQSRSSSRRSLSRSRSRSRTPSSSHHRRREGSQGSLYQRRASEPLTSVRINGLTKMVYERHLRDIFEEYGDVRDVIMPRYHVSGDNRSKGFVVFSNASAATKAADHMNMGQIDGAVISVETCRAPRPDHDARVRGFGHGRGYGREREDDLWTASHGRRDARGNEVGAWGRRSGGAGAGAERGYGSSAGRRDREYGSQRDPPPQRGGDEWRADPRPVRTGRWAPPARSRSRSPPPRRRRSMSIDGR